MRCDTQLTKCIGPQTDTLYMRRCDQVSTFCYYASHAFLIGAVRFIFIRRHFASYLIVLELWPWPLTFNHDNIGRYHLPHAHGAVVGVMLVDKLRQAGITLNCSGLFLGRPRSEGWPHHGRAFSIYLCPLSFWLTLPQRVLSTTWCCLFRPCVVFLACVHLALFLALFLSPGNSLVS